LGCLASNVTAKIEFAEPWKNLRNLKTLPLRPNPGFYFFDEILVSKTRIRQ
jgi:hypothetical protein